MEENYHIVLWFSEHDLTFTFPYDEESARMTAKEFIVSKSKTDGFIAAMAKKIDRYSLLTFIPDKRTTDEVIRLEKTTLIKEIRWLSGCGRPWLPPGYSKFIEIFTYGH